MPKVHHIFVDDLCSLIATQRPRVIYDPACQMLPRLLRQEKKCLWKMHEKKDVNFDQNSYTEFIGQCRSHDQTYFQRGWEKTILLNVPKKDHWKYLANSTNDNHLTSCMQHGCHHFIQHIHIQAQEQRRRINRDSARLLSLLSAKAFLKTTPITSTLPLRPHQIFTYISRARTLWHDLPWLEGRLTTMSASFF